ncbi:glucosamine--fructose-6-phosphate aminotransferase (isomerizing) [Aneurinibacillus soli]|uniref:Glutamine--fructose-6-phosphate aminotransferase [isomerizing] n=1 Tax=Aneurinibacillus soli TaxID=1500254 RepID=A0A0U4WGE5_9BACL|nr:glutamine--fructose-6-phosphate transaminase (isomerizing) [Aneurinibacillus soli]PYE61384.1 glucosamine--fructose-6-phosphate aminotransferase (isomerizing) [Aneurinibacillus soli]BAU27787.1 Glutamine--fructose-6-phosphate aminotransferase [isomerizing] [Aneurinibacillus soli]
MSGIVGFIGKRNALPILLDCLDTLDYRGYDSAGIAISDESTIHIRKTVGRIDDLRAVVNRDLVTTGILGIGHTRWATHGIPSEANSHPLTGCDDRFIVVHNGIIENYPQLKRNLLKQGHTFATETDTEVIPHLLEEYDTGDFEKTVQAVLPMLVGSFALAIMSKEQPDMIIAVSQNNPLVLGRDKTDLYFASDIPAMLPFTRQFYPIQNGEYAVLTQGHVTIKKFADGTEICPIWRLADETLGDVLLNEYEHYMRKEIFDQPKALRDTLAGRLTEDGVELAELAAAWDAGLFARVRKIDIVASGTSYHAGLIGKKALEQLLHFPVAATYSSEFVHEHANLDETNLVILLSQSGETADTLSALREAQKYGCPTIAITNTAGSTISRKADCTLLTKAGPELAVASTKAYTAQIATMLLLAVWTAQRMSSLQPTQVADLLAALRQLPTDVESTLIMIDDAIDQLAQVTYDQESLFLIGRGLDYVLALEGALKLQEIAYIHADAYAAGEMKHGTMALITPGMPVIALATQTGSVFDKTISNIREVKARDAFVVGITTVSDDVLADEVDEVMYIPETHPLLMPVLAAIPLQLLAYYAGTVRGNDVDRPRNLAKSLTVE